MPCGRRLLASLLSCLLAGTAAPLLAGSEGQERFVAVAAGPQDPRVAELSSDLIVRKLAPGVWLHVSFKQTAVGRLPANGLVVTTGEMSLLIDTGWTVDQTRALLEWADRTLGQPIEHVIITHAHEDRAGGIAALDGRTVIVQGHAGTNSRLRAAGRFGLNWSFEFEERLTLGGETVDLFYPRAGHAPDNIVVWLPRRKLLFGGCMVKSLASNGLGYTGDADLRRWPRALRRVIDRYPDAELVIPGHGHPGGRQLLSHTMGLLEQALAAQGAASRERRGRLASLPGRRIE